MAEQKDKKANQAKKIEMMSINRAVERMVQTINIRQSLWILFFRLLLLSLVTFGVIAFALLFQLDIQLFSLSTMQLLSVYLGVFTVHFAAIVLIVLRWHYHVYRMNEGKIVKQKGIIRRKEEVCAIKNVESLTLRQNFLQGLLGFGSIRFYAPTLNKRITMHNIPNPQQYLVFAEALIEREAGDKPRMGAGTTMLSR